MNPTLLQHPSFDFPLTSEHNYSCSERTYSSLGGYSSNDPFSFLPRRTLNGGSNSKPSSSLAGTANSGSESSPQPPLTDAVYHSASHSWLSAADPPTGSIGTGGGGGGGANVACSFANATLPKPQISNVSSDQFSAISGPTLPTSWRDSATSDLDRPRLSILPPALSPHQNCTAPGIKSYRQRPIMERLLGNYSTSAPLTAPFISRTQTFLRQGHYDPFASTDNVYSTMPHGDSQRQEGPSFRETQVIHQPLNAKGNSLRPEIVANIQKGFFQVDGKWTCYRRNYFSVSCSFTLGPGSAEGPFYLKEDQDSHAEPIQRFGMVISAKTSAASNQDSEVRELVQHTPKRSKDTESIPVRQVVVPSPWRQAQHPNALLPFAGVGGGIDGAAKYHGSQTHSPFGFPNYPDPQSSSAPTSHTFDRIQFAKATANNGKRRAQQQYFHVVVELWACVSSNHGENWVLVATQDSDQVVVRGRSPGHYKDNNRRDSQSNMDPDRLSGPGSDESSGAHNYGSTYPPAMNWQSSHSGQLHHGQASYPGGRAYQHHDQPCLAMDWSPPSTSSSTTPNADSPPDLMFHHSETEVVLRAVDFGQADRSSRLITPTPPSPEAIVEENFFDLGGGALISRKRSRDEAESKEDDPPFRSLYPFSDTLSASSHSMNFLPAASSKIPCAS